MKYGKFDWSQSEGDSTLYSYSAKQQSTFIPQIGFLSGLILFSSILLIPDIPNQLQEIVTYIIIIWMAFGVDSLFKLGVVRSLIEFAREIRALNE